MNPIKAFNHWYDNINSSSLRLLVFLVVVSPMFLMLYPPLLTPLLIKFGVGVFYGCLAWVAFLLVMRRWWLTRAR